MRDLFDDFMDELRRREAEARGEDPDAVAPRRRRPSEPAPEPDGDGDGDGDGADDHDPEGDGPDEADASGSGGQPPRPIRGRKPGGPNDGGGFGSRVRRAGRALGIGLAALILLALIALFAFGIEIWTDALWFQSVGYSDVYWTRIAAQVGLFVFGLVLALIVLLGNLWLAGRLTPPPIPGGGTVRNLFDRLNEAAEAAEVRRTGGARRWSPPDDRRSARVAWNADDIPDLSPIATWVLAGLVVLFALGVAGSLATAWETVLLWQNRVPFSETASVTDPIFGRDISFFLFELPFLRLVQALFNGLVLTALLLVSARYLVGAMRGAPIFTTRVRMHLAILGGLFLLSVAFGYQLDKFELVYSTRASVETSAIDIVGVSFTDQNAQFFAYDLLTVLSGLAAAFLVGAAFTRMLWPFGLTLGVWFLASILIGRAYPEAVQYFTVRPNQFAQEEPYISNNIAMTRLAFGLDTWEDNRPFGGEAKLTEEAIVNDEDTFRNARLWDYRPLGDSFDQLQAIRPYYDFTDVDTDRYTIADVQRQVMLSARELDPSALGGGWVNERINFTHGIGMAMTPVNEVTTEGQPRLIIRNLPPVSSEGAPEIKQPRIYFGERPSGYVVVGARDDEFDYPTGSSDVSGTSTRWTGDSGINLDTTLMRVLFALRFRDLNLLISDQVTNESQLLFDRAIAQRLPKIAPFLRYDKDPYIVVDEATGGLVYVQDAYTVSDRFPNSNWFDPGELESTNLGGGAFNYIRNSVKVTIDAYTGTTTFYVADPNDPIVRTYAKVFPTLFRPLTDMPESLTVTSPLPGGAVQRPDPDVRAVPRHDTAAVLPERRPVDGARGPDDRADPPVRGVLRDHADARRTQGRVPAPAADGPAQPAKHDRLGGGAHGPRRLRHDTRLPLPVRYDGLRSGADRGTDRRRRCDQRTAHAVEPGRQHGHPGQPHRDPGRRFRGVSPAVLPAVDGNGAARIPADRGCLAARGGLVADARRRPASPAGGGGGWRRDAATGPG